MKALIKTAEKNGYKMGLFLQAQNGWASRCRNIYDPKELAEAGFEYSAIGC